MGYAHGLLLLSRLARGCLCTKKSLATTLALRVLTRRPGSLRPLTLRTGLVNTSTCDSLRHFLRLACWHIFSEPAVAAGQTIRVGSGVTDARRPLAWLALGMGYAHGLLSLSRLARGCLCTKKSLATTLALRVLTRRPGSLRPLTLRTGLVNTSTCDSLRHFLRLACWHIFSEPAVAAGQTMRVGSGVTDARRPLAWLAQGVRIALINLGPRLRL